MMKALKALATRGRSFLISPLLRAYRLDPAAGAVAQLQLKLTYRSLLESGATLPPFEEAGFRAFSQTDEDGLLLFIFAVIGTGNKRCVEVCAGNGIECNTANLIITHGWHGLLVDGNPSLVEEGREFYRNHPCTRIYPPPFVNEWISRDNVNHVVEQQGFSGEIDLLSIDMDGVDYWIWEALTAVRPRVVVVEYQDILGPKRSLTVPYADDFRASDHPTTRGMPNFCGASLPAFAKLAARRGYRLVGCNRYGFNAFFVRNPLGEKELPEIEISQCFHHPKVRWGMEERFATVKDFPWVDV